MHSGRWGEQQAADHPSKDDRGKAKCSGPEHSFEVYGSLDPTDPPLTTVSPNAQDLRICPNHRQLDNSLCLPAGRLILVKSQDSQAASFPPTQRFQLGTFPTTESCQLGRFPITQIFQKEEIWGGLAEPRPSTKSMVLSRLLGRPH